MFLSAKNKGYFIDQGEQTTYLARVTSLTAPLVIEAIIEIPSGDTHAFSEAVSSLTPKKTSGYLFAHCSCNPVSKFVRKATLDLKRVKEAEYFPEILNTQFKIEHESHAVAVLNSADGLLCDFNKPGHGKDVVFCGLSNADLLRYQEQLLENNLFPNRIELSSLSALGAVINYLKFTQSTKPVLVLELGADQTQSYIVSSRGLESSRPIAVGLDAMVPVVQKELGLKDEDSARKLFLSNTFDFTGLGPALCKRLLKELQSSMGFYEVQTGQSIGHVVCSVLPSKLHWLENVIAAQIGVNVMTFDYAGWLAARQITLSDSNGINGLDARKLALIGLGLTGEFSTPETNPTTKAGSS